MDNMSLLPTINSPADLKDLGLEELETLSGELREAIIGTVAKTGGHLASSLGTIDLTIGLHYVFNTPRDKIVWDVGHQVYAHKFLTGRRDRMETLRQEGGLSGFTNIFESEYDAFGAGHASTSISAALGLAHARDLRGEDFEVVAVIGDGSLTGGLAYEALNNAGISGTNLLVVVNDNEMSISENVGAIRHCLNRLITGRFYNRAKRDIEAIVERIPHLGRRLRRYLNKVQEGVKGMLAPGLIFEELGLRYFGPINGHDMDEIVETLQRIRDFKEPRVLHVLTQKGHGYPPAEEDPSQWHGASPFDPDTADTPEDSVTVSLTDPPPTFTEVFSQTIVEIAKADSSVVGITAAMPSGTGLDALQKVFPDRFYDVGIAEEHAVTFAAGLARGGVLPVVAIYSTFMQRAVDQFLHDVCLQSLPVIVCMDRAGAVGSDGATHQGLFDISLLRPIPGLVLMAPADERELVQALWTARALKKPVAIRYPRDRGTGGGYDAAAQDVWKVGEAVTVREGADVAVFALGPTLSEALRAAQILSCRGIECRVVNPRFVKPVDEGLIAESAKHCQAVVTVEDHALAGGFGSLVNEVLARQGDGTVPVLNLGVPDQFIDHAARRRVLEKVGLTGDRIAKRIERFVRPLLILKSPGASIEAL
jgi:1-deoxy-D-xylulose-5-phosphate synthase